MLIIHNIIKAALNKNIELPSFQKLLNARNDDIFNEFTSKSMKREIHILAV
jgi:hypothetical protein